MNNRTKLVVAAIAVLVLLSLAVVWMVPRQKQLNRTHATLANVRQAMDRFEADTKQIPVNLSALLDKPGSGGWKGPYLTTDSLKDPWGHAIRYTCTNGHSELMSAGWDGLFDTKDDIRNLRATPNQVPHAIAGKPGSA